MPKPKPPITAGKMHDPEKQREHRNRASLFACALPIIGELQGWVHSLTAPLLPPRIVVENGFGERAEFIEHLPHTVMVGKLVRAVSGLKAAMTLAQLGYIVECASLLRMVSDFCLEITAVGEGIRSNALPVAVDSFVRKYFTPKPRTPAEFAALEKDRYTTREELMKAEVRMAEHAKIDGEIVRSNRRFVNMLFDAYVHGAYETTMELYDPSTGQFALSGHPNRANQQEHMEMVCLKLHDVVVAAEFTASVMANAEVFEAARKARHKLDAIPSVLKLDASGTPKTF